MSDLYFLNIRKCQELYQIFHERLVSIESFNKNSSAILYPQNHWLNNHRIGLPWSISYMIVMHQLYDGWPGEHSKVSWCSEYYFKNMKEWFWSPINCQLMTLTWRTFKGSIYRSYEHIIYYSCSLEENNIVFEISHPFILLLIC